MPFFLHWPAGRLSTGRDVARLAANVKPYDHTIAGRDGGYGGGRAIPIGVATLRIAGAHASQTVSADQPGAVFELGLPAGPAHTETWLGVGEGASLSAYYVNVEPARSSSNATRRQRNPRRPCGLGGSWVTPRRSRR